ncbi:Tyrosine-protein kinase Wzc [plant metagenome]|uniref:Tyrosine-protein kinase Wzc n=1 Tax=plant metagenome TaxID=1297885 RepID=A0A484SS28_9ZZZZ
MNVTPQYAADNGLFSLNQILAMIMARKTLVLRTIAAVMLVTLAIVMLLPRTWVAVSDLYIDSRDNDPLASRGFSPGLDESYMQTQIEMIRSQAVAERVIEALGLRQQEQYQKNLRSMGEVRAREKLLETLSRNTQVTSGRGNRVLAVSFSAPSPTQARDITNAIVRAYLEMSQAISSSAARSRTEQYNAQLEQLRTEADQLQDKLTQYQREHGIFNDKESDDLEVKRLEQMTATLLTLQNAIQEAEARNAATQRLLASGVRADELPSVAQLAAIAALKSSLVDTDRVMGDVRGSLGANHPRIRGLQQERNDLVGRINRAAKGALESQQAEVERLKAQQEALQGALETQRNRVLEQKLHYDRIAVYQRQLASVEQIYHAALQKYDGLLMASNINLGNVTVLRAAEAPSTHASPRTISSVVASVPVGAILALCLALLLELRQRRVRCTDDLVRGIGMPLLGRIGAPPFRPKAAKA